MSQPPSVSVAGFKTRFDRDFNYGDGLEVVRDSDISNAMVQAGMVFNPSLFEPTQEAPEAFYQASAHFVALNVQAAGGLSACKSGLGVLNSGEGTVDSKTVGDVSLAFSNSERVKNSPALSNFLRTGYGLNYLAFVCPRLINGYAVAGPGNPDTSGPIGIKGGKPVIGFEIDQESVAALQNPGDLFYFVAPFNVFLVNFGVIFETILDPAGAGFIMEADLRPTVDSDTGREVLTSAGNLDLSHSQLVGMAYGTKQTKQCAPGVLIQQGQQVVLKVTQATSGDSTGKPFITWVTCQ